MAADIQNVYLQAPASEKHYIICGNEFGIDNAGKVVLTRRALYGGKSSSADFLKHLRTCMEHLHFNPCKGDSEVWMREALDYDGTPYWEYVLLYVDDVLCVSAKCESVIRNELVKYFQIKESSIGPPDIYLGNKISKVTLENGNQAWSFSLSQYVQAAVRNVEKYLKEQNKCWSNKAMYLFKGD